MRTTSRGIYCAAISVSLVSFLLTVAAANDAPLVRITNYKQWSKVSQDLSKGTFTFGDLSSVGG